MKYSFLEIDWKFFALNIHTNMDFNDWFAAYGDIDEYGVQSKYTNYYFPSRHD